MTCEHCNSLDLEFVPTTVCGWCGLPICETCRKAYPPVCDEALNHLRAQAEYAVLDLMEDLAF